MATYDSSARWDDPSLHFDEVTLAPNITMNKNKVSAVLAATAVTNITTAVATIRTNLPFLITLSVAERRSLPKVNEATQGLIFASQNFVNQHPEALPASFNTAEFLKDAALVAPLTQANAAVAQLATDLEDTLMALFSDAYSEVLDVYAFAKANNRSGAYDNYLATIKGRFAHGAKKAKNTPPPTT